MEVISRGGGEPELVVIGSVHGDEPAGRNAIKNVLEATESFRKPVKFIIANEKALERGERFLEADLNSSFPGDASSSKHEERLAAEITGEVRGKTVIDLHTTRSTEDSFATVKSLDEGVVELFRDSGVENCVCFPEDSGVLIEEADRGMIVEAGIQGTEAAEKRLEETLRNFLACRDVINGSCTPGNPDFFRYMDTVEGDWEFVAENFRKVEEGEVYAVREDQDLKAEESFYPVLMSTDGYDGKLGYRAEKLEMKGR